MTTARDRLIATVDAICADNPMGNFARLRAATMGARERTGKPVGTAVKQGAFSVCLTFYGKRKTTVEVLADGLTVEGAIAYLDAMN